MLLLKTNKQKTLQKEHTDPFHLKPIPSPSLGLEKQAITLGIINIMSDVPKNRGRYCFKID